MFTQSQVLRTLRAPESQARLPAVLGDAALSTRAAIARRVCELFTFVDACGRLQVSTCARALSKLADRGRIALPAPTNNYAAGAGPRLLAEPVPAPERLPEVVNEVEGLTLVKVTDTDQREIWNTLLHHEHPRGVTTFCGAQVRYLIDSVHGYLGAVGFSAAALRLAAREQWMAWSDAQRQAHLHRVVCLSRFLMRERCQHLASYVLSRLLRRLAEDYQQHYGYRVWVVETYVDPEWSGSCFKATNFQYIGQTAGGLRHDTLEPPKALYVYELHRRWRQQLGMPAVELRPVRQPGEMLDSEQWADAEFGDAPLGNTLRSARLVKSASLLANSIGAAITGNTGYDRAAVKGHYRLLASDPASEVTPENVLAPHRARTIERMRSQKVVLCIQDGSRLNYGSRLACEDLEVIGQNQATTKSRGLHIHTTLATTTDGLPLGVLRCSYKDPTDGPLKPKAQRWLDGYADICEAAQELSRKIKVLCVMDREGDSFALFDAQRQHKRVDLLVRASKNRRLAKGKKLFETMSGGKAAKTIRIEIHRRSVRSKTAGRAYRVADAEVRYGPVTLPATPLVADADPVTLTGVHIKEVSPPAGEKAIEWYLLTSLAVPSARAAERVLGYYLKRWRIEDFFRVLKSGCKVEHMQLRSALRLERALAIYCVIAWRLMVLTLLGRTMPELDPSVFFTELELGFLTGYAKRVRLPEPKMLRDAMLLVGVLGGYQNRNRAPPPGHQVMWRGIERLAMALVGYQMHIEETQARCCCCADS